MTDHFVLIPLLTESYSDRIVAALVRRGYVVRAASPESGLASTRKGYLGAALAISVTAPGHRQFDDESKALQAVYSDLRTILGEIRASYFALFVAEDTFSARWGSGNVPLEGVHEASPATWHERLASDEGSGS